MLAIRLLILLVLVFFVFIIINVLVSSSRTRLKLRRKPLAEGEELVLCLQCQSYVPKTEAVSSHENYFCREECARLFMRNA
jgi:uncharacterized protein